MRLAGVTEQGDTVVVWITRRLLDRLLSQLAELLENATTQVLGVNPTRTHAMQSFAQQAAQLASAPQKPVRPQAEDAQWLVHSVDIAYARGDVRLTLRGGDAQHVDLDFVEGKLRQFLNILLEAYRAADWPLTAWPAWARSSSRHADSLAQIH